MTEVTIHDISAHDVMIMVNSVREYGIVQGKDFDWYFYPEKFPDKKKTVFKFYSEQHASFFALKWL